MAYTNDIRIGNVSIVERFVELRKSVAEALERRRVYRQTVNELSALSGRELNDLGINRSTIRSIAYEAAYGK